MMKIQPSNIKPNNIKPSVRDYLIIVLTRFLPLTKKARRDLRYKLLKVKEDIVLYESVSYIIPEVVLALLLSELLFREIGIVFQFYLIKNSFVIEILMIILEYVLFLVVHPISSLLFYPFTGFWVKFEKENKFH